MDVWGGSVVGTNAFLDVSTLGALPQDSLDCTATATDGDGASDTGSAGCIAKSTANVTASIRMVQTIQEC